LWGKRREEAGQKKNERRKEGGRRMIVFVPKRTEEHFPLSLSLFSLSLS
jgi:hypothetical protein